MQAVSPVSRDFVSLTPHAFYQKVESIITNWCLKEHPSDPLASIDQISDHLPLDKLEEAIRSHNQTFQDVATFAKNSVEQAHYYLSHIEKPQSQVTIGTMICEALLVFLEGLLEVFGVADFFEPAETAFQASTKFQKVMMLTSFTFLTTELVPMLGAAVSGLIIGGLLLTLVLLSLIYPYIRPCPSKIPHASNWTRQIQEGVLPMAYERKNIRDLLAETLIAGQTMKKYPMLIGKTRVGKTQAAIAFAHAVARGDYPELQNKTVFYVNSADLIAASDPFGSKTKALDALKKEIGHHKGEVILIIDEIHLTQQPENKAIGDQLKILLDQGDSSFPFVIGITTEEDFYRDIYRSDFAFAERFKQIPVDSTTDEETLAILSLFLLKEANEVLIDEGILSYILEKSKEKVQPASSLQLLSRSITKVRELSPRDQKIDSLRERISSLRASQPLFTVSNEIAALEREVTSLVEKLEVQKKQLQELLHLQSHIPKVKEEAFRTALKVADLHSSVEEQKRLLLLTHFLNPLLEKYLREKSEEGGVSIVINKKLIDQIVEEDELLRKNVEEHIRRGALSIEERTLTK